jgi:hypothetical protein
MRADVQSSNTPAHEGEHHRRLAGGEDVVHFRDVQRREAEIIRPLEALSQEELFAEVRRCGLLSANAKTTASLDFPIGQTCSPTASCAAHCYATRPGATTMWSKSLRLRLRNWRYLKCASTRTAEKELDRDFRNTQARWAQRGVQLDYLRISGTGDLFPELVLVVNRFARRHQDVRVWIVTRQFDLAAKIASLPNVFLQLSLDSTTSRTHVEKIRKLLERHPRAYASFLRERPDDDVSGCAIVFNEKRTTGLPFNGRTDCPVDAGQMPLGNDRGEGGTACSRCRKCFEDRVLDRQRSLPLPIPVGRRGLEVLP